MQAFACGLSAARTRLQISFLVMTLRLIHHNGALLSPTSPAPIATSLLISRTSPSSPTLICAAAGQVQPVCTPKSTDVRALVQILSSTMPRHLRMLIGSLQASESGQHHRYQFAGRFQDTLILIRISYILLTSCLASQQLRSHSLCCRQFVIRRQVDNEKVQNILNRCQ